MFFGVKIQCGHVADFANFDIVAFIRTIGRVIGGQVGNDRKGIFQDSASYDDVGFGLSQGVFVLGTWAMMSAASSPFDFKAPICLERALRRVWIS